MRRTQTGNKYRSAPCKVQWTVPGAKEDVDASKKKAHQARLKPDVTWINAPKGTSMKRQHFPVGYKEPPNLDPEIAAQFVVGRPVISTKALTMSQDMGTYNFAHLEPFYGSPDEAHIPVGSLLVYIGEIRQQERMYVNGKHHDVFVVKHTFITPMGRCIIHDFNLIRLITEEDIT